MGSGTFCRVIVSSIILVWTVRADCDSPPIISNASSNITGSPPYPEGTVARYECNIGFSPVGGTNRYYTCSNTDWTGGNFRCEVIRCSYIEPPENGRVINEPTYEAGTTIEFTCDEGHDMSGPDVMLCRTDRNWSPSTPPTCNAKDCGEFEAIQYASIFQDNSQGERNHYGSVVEVTCQGGRVLNGPPRVTCEASGHWGQRPTCELLQCPPYPNTNASCISNSQLLGDFYFILCKEDISTRTGPDAAECINGAWDSREMACYCDCIIPDLSPNLITINNLNTHGNVVHESSLQWTCNGGSTRLNVDSVICTDGRLKVMKDGEEVTYNVGNSSDTNLEILQELCKDSSTKSDSVTPPASMGTTVKISVGTTVKISVGTTVKILSGKNSMNSATNRILSAVTVYLIFFCNVFSMLI